MFVPGLDGWIDFDRFEFSASEHYNPLMMDSFGVRQNRALRDRIEKMIEDRLSHIIDKRCTSHEDYLGKCEAVEALREVLIASEQIHKKLIAEATGQVEIESPVHHDPSRGQQIPARINEKSLYRS